MKLYEGLFIFPPEQAGEVGKEQQKKLEDAIKKFGGTVSQKQDWGKKTLGYAIRKFREGHILVWDIQIDGPRISELRKALELHEDLLNYMISIKQPDAPVRPPRPRPERSGPPSGRRSFTPRPKPAATTGPSHASKPE